MFKFLRIWLDSVPMDVGQQAEALRRAGKLREALRVYEEHLSAHPCAVVGLNNAATIHLEMRNPAAAIGLLEKAVELKPRYAAAWGNLGEAMEMRGDLQRAAQSYETSVSIAPNKSVQQSLDNARAMLRGKAMGGPTSPVTMQVTCTECGGPYVAFGAMVPTNIRVLGGARCKSCGVFYCEPCVARALGGSGPMACQCGKARASLSGAGELVLDGFDELVVRRP